MNKYFGQNTKFGPNEVWFRYVSLYIIGVFV